jgi:hypothetical protein
MTYLANHVHGFFDTIDADGSGDINFEVRCARRRVSPHRFCMCRHSCADARMVLTSRRSLSLQLFRNALPPRSAALSSALPRSWTSRAKATLWICRPESNFACLVSLSSCRVRQRPRGGSGEQFTPLFCNCVGHGGLESRHLFGSKDAACMLR